MSHVTGAFVSLAGTPISIGPAFGAGNNVNFIPTAPPPAHGATKYVILHFQNASFPGTSRLEINLGYPSGEIDVFTSADGADFWSRPINVKAFPGDTVPITFFPDGGGGAQITGYGRGERHEEEVPGGSHDSFSNSDPFLITGSFLEPQYDPFWFCHQPPHWDNVAALPDGDIRKKVSHGVGMLVSVHGPHVSTCSCTLVGDDLVISAAHCIDLESDIASMSVIFNYQTKPNGDAPDGYSPVFHKIVQVINHGPLGGSSNIDYLLLRVKTPPGGLGIPPIPMRSTRPSVGEQVFGVSHPNGAVKKVSPSIADGFAVVTQSPSPPGRIHTQFDITGGSSGSGLFDTSGRFLGVLSSGWGGPFAPIVAERHAQCDIEYACSDEILNHLSGSLPASISRDVMLVLDRSGSMSEMTDSGLTKLQEAKNAASLFIQLIRAAGSDQVGLVTFSSSATTNFNLADVNAGNKNTLIGPAPFNTGIVGAIAAGGNTSIGAGLNAALSQFTANGLGGNKRTVLLMTDGLQNTAPNAEGASAALTNTDIFAVGYGTETSLNGELLTQIAQDHNGLYMRANDGLALMKFFALTFGNIFEAGTLHDPDYVLPAAKDHADPLPFSVCEESTVTIVLGWDKIVTPLSFRVQAPSGAIISPSAPGVEVSHGQTWTFMRIALPANGEQNGTWKVLVDRVKGGGEFPIPPADVRYFVNVLAKDGPVVKLSPQRKYYYTGEAYNPMIAIVKSDGYRAPNGKVSLYISKPLDGTGNILSKHGFENTPGEMDGDFIPARISSLKKLEARQKGQPLINYGSQVVSLVDEGSHWDGAMEPDGIFGINLPDLFRHEGHYTFRAVAQWGDGCTGSREISWSVHVLPGIDPGMTTVTTETVTALGGGKQRIRITFIPKDKFGNLLGPGRPGSFSLSAASGTVLSGGSVKDYGDGKYSVIADYDPSSGNPPGLVVSQPGREPAVVTPQDSKPRKCRDWTWLIAFLLLIIVILTTWIISQC